MKSRQNKPYDKMNADELAEATREFDHEFVGTPGRPLTAGQKAMHDKARKKGGRPRIGKGSQRILVSLEKELLQEADLLARRRNLSRSQLIANTLREALKAG